MAKQLYANRETKVFHSPAKKDSCRVAEILPKNRVKFPSPEDAEKAGFRKCGRCRWNGTGS